MGMEKKVMIIGGGIAGLTCAIILQKAGFQVTLFEKKRYPFHRVCGEYISNETLPFLQSLEIPFTDVQPSCINRLSVTTERGKQLFADLPMGGFGLSRFKLDDSLFQHAQKLGVGFLFEKVIDIKFQHSSFQITSVSGTHTCDIAIATHGKRSNIDQKLNRGFFSQRSPYLGVKYHIRTDLPENLIRLDNFSGGYSGVCKIEDDKFNLCYLSRSSNLKNYHGIADMEEHVLHRNPFLRHLFKNSDFIYAKPEVINEISFAPKTLIEDHLLFCGDSAGMITPLCGNGMAMAFHSAKILSECIIKYAFQETFNRNSLEREYRDRWRNEFQLRLKTGRMIQGLFGRPFISELAVSVLQSLPRLNQMIVKKTHGKAFK